MSENFRNEPIPLSMNYVTDLDIKFKLQSGILNESYLEKADL